MIPGIPNPTDSQSRYYHEWRGHRTLVNNTGSNERFKQLMRNPQVKPETEVKKHEPRELKNTAWIGTDPKSKKEQRI